MLKQRIEQDLKNAMLGGDKQRVSTLRVVKSVILYAEVAKGSRDTGLSDNEVIELLSKEAKKRQETARIYQKAGENGRAEAELAEKKIIDAYLPEQLSDDDLKRIVQEVIKSTGAASPQDMGRVIGEVKNRVGSSADGSRIARLVKEGLVQV
jgi:uncharacterized protein YqeY